MIKEVRLEEEKKQVIDFLLKHQLQYETNITDTLFITDEASNIIATVSTAKNIIKCLAVDENHQGENLASILIGEMINRLYKKNIYHYMVYTKIQYKDIFLSLGFKEIVQTEKISILESGVKTIYDDLEKIKKHVENKFSINLFEHKINALVCNCNPVTNGHVALIEEALKTSEFVIVFLLEENNSLFTFDQRLSLLFIAVLHLQNVIVLPATEYIISLLTFPTYFLKEESEYNYQWMKSDALIFRNYFMKELNISARYVGTEDNKVMNCYNNVLKEVLQDGLVEVKRFEGISASTVRQLVKENRIDEALELIPHSCKTLFKMIVSKI